MILKVVITCSGEFLERYLDKLLAWTMFWDAMLEILVTLIYMFKILNPSSSKHLGAISQSRQYEIVTEPVKVYPSWLSCPYHYTENGLDRTALNLNPL